MSRRFGLLHHQNLLDHVTEVSRDRIRPEGQVQQGGACGGGPCITSTTAHVPQGEED